MATFDVLQGRVLPMAIAWASRSAAEPLSWGLLELLVLGALAQIGLEFYRNGVPYMFDSWDKLPARGRPLEKFATRDMVCIAASQLAIVFMMFHYLQFMAASPTVLWRLDQV